MSRDLDKKYINFIESRLAASLSTALPSFTKPVLLITYLSATAIIETYPVYYHKQEITEMKVEPIRSVKDIRAIKKLLASSPRDFALFVLGINTNLRASDILALTVGHVRRLKVGEEIVLKEKKTGKQRRITVNAEIVDAVGRLMAFRLAGNRELRDEAPLFVGQRGVMTVPTLSRLVGEWCEAVNLKGNYGSHSMRKTWGFHQRTRLNTSVAELMVMFNHSNQRQTLDYLCIQPDEIREAYLKLSY